MNEHTFDRMARTFLADGPTVLADRVYEAAFREVRRTRQRRATGRVFRMDAPVPFVAMTALSVALLAVVATTPWTAIGPSSLTGSESQIGSVWTSRPNAVLTWQPATSDPRTPYLAAVVYDEFLGRSWAVSDDATVVERAAGVDLLVGSVDAADPATRREFRLTITPTSTQPVVLFAGQPLRVDRPVSVEVVGSESFLARLTRAASRDAYAITALIPAAEVEGGPTPPRLRSAGTDYPPGMLARYGRAAVPDRAVTTPEARALLDEIMVLGGDNPFALAEATERLLKDPTRFTYDTDVRDLDCGDRSIVDCFATFRRGYCQYYASTMAILLRELDIPTRYVEGYLAGVQDPVTGRWTVRSSDAHAWVQVYFPSYGWIDFDPTGGGRAVLAPLPSGQPEAAPSEGG